MIIIIPILEIINTHFFPQIFQINRTLIFQNIFGLLPQFCALCIHSFDKTDWLVFMSNIISMKGLMLIIYKCLESVICWLTLLWREERGCNITGEEYRRRQYKIFCRILTDRTQHYREYFQYFHSPPQGSFDKGHGRLQTIYKLYLKNFSLQTRKNPSACLGSNASL